MPTEDTAPRVNVGAMEMTPHFYLGEPGKGVIAMVSGRIGRGGLVATYCDCSTCACGSCACNCSCNACGACYCDCSCQADLQISMAWRTEDLASLARVMEVMKVPFGDAKQIAEAIRVK